MTHRITAIAVGCLVSLAPFCAMAEEDATTAANRFPGPDAVGPMRLKPRPTVTLTIENDYFAGTDRNYSTGTRLSFTSPPLLGNSPLNFAEAVADTFLDKKANDLVLYEIAVGQNIYTPEDRLATEPLPDQHPYAGYLYAEFSVFVGRPKDRKLDSLTLQVGLVGPSSGGEWVQDNVHRLIGDDELAGWDNQLEDEVGFALSFNRKHRFEVVGEGTIPGGFGVDIIPSYGATGGTVLTQLDAGVTVRVGWDLDFSFGPSRVRPALSAASIFAAETESLTGFFFVGFEGRAVARNIFLDGNTFRESLSVDKTPLVGDIQAGFVTQYDDWAFTYTFVSRGEEFDGQDGRQNFGSFSIVKRF